MTDGLLQDMFAAAVAAADPAEVLPRHLPPVPKGRTVVVGFGKAAASMALAVEEHWQGPLEGLVITRYGHSVPCRRIEVIEAGHPVPDAEGQQAARKIVALAEELGPDDLLLCLASGGGSALFVSPLPGITLADKQAVNQSLLKSGATIAEMNCVRKHLSAVKGGRLATIAYPARVVTLAISDVPGDDPAVIASGPTVADPTSLADAEAIIKHYGVEVPDSVQRCWAVQETETPKPGDPCLASSVFRLIATPGQALAAAANVAKANNIEPVILGDAIEGDSCDVAVDQARQALDMVSRAPCVLLSSGETTVTVRGQGRGGRNGEFILALALRLNGHPGVSAIACDTDGIDGTEDNAGAIIRPDTLDRAQALGLNAAAILAENDSYSLFAALGDLVITGPTLTNVNDFRAVLIT